MPTKLGPQKQRILRYALLGFIGAAAVYDVAFLTLINHSVIYYPSVPWKSASKALAFILSASLLISPLFDDKDITAQKPTLALTIASLFIFYGLLLNGLGLAFNGLISSPLQEDVDGTKVTLHSKLAADSYFIRSPDLPEDFFSRFYIPQSDFDAMPDDVRLHVTFNESFFGKTVKSYTLYY